MILEECDASEPPAAVEAVRTIARAGVTDLAEPVQAPGGLPEGWDVLAKDNGTAFCLEGPWVNTRAEAIASLPRTLPETARVGRPPSAWFRSGHRAALEAAERICRERAEEYAMAGEHKQESACEQCADEIATFGSTFRTPDENHVNEEKKR